MYRGIPKPLNSFKKAVFLLAIASSSFTQTLAAQTNLPPNRPIAPDSNPKTIPINPPEPTKLPSPDRLLAPITPQTPEIPSNNNSETIVVKKFEILGSTVFSDAELAEITKDYLNKPISINELFQIRTKITKLYLDNKYVTSGAYIPEQNFQSGTFRIQIVEGGIEEIKVTGLTRLNQGYIQSRIAIATQKPLNSNRLLEALQLLQINPLIDSISANLSPSLQPGLNNLDVKVTEAKTFSLPITIDNGRTPSVGTDRRQIQLSEANLTGLGDRLNLTYSNTDGSNSFDSSYTLPFNPYNGTISFSFGTSSSKVIQVPFNFLDIVSSSRNYGLSIRQPLLQSTSQELALGLSLNRTESQASLLGGTIPYPSQGADENGQTKISALRFFQEYVQRSGEEVFAARSQISLGINAFGATINTTFPDSRFLAWRGQAQYVRLLAPETLLFLRGDLQLADRPLLSQEQISFGGQETLRGFRQDSVSTDNGLMLSAELRIPLMRVPEISGLLQVVPFFDFGEAWNNNTSTNPDPSTLASVGVGLRFQMSDRLTMRLDWGIPLSRITGDKQTLQERGLYFSLVANPF
ncbi:ShlB/FhaC/HecB family hemolysin secretion/activation protein [Pseudanabaena yagii GIHE-NHR1]|uniref:ShlB/FhaC/HecB family hemolysin secretion/activation protein n=1 Tax=Pseudanabaena yagii GIHE-NHR1 TaxID=2722753 RepID=A0ABX1M0F1_9CYAN|nr:ShlB/FhaC/HecB family hemolysin secretion/activation protein [Pseudanabaena yagii GIHE-NHR1]